MTLEQIINGGLSEALKEVEEAGDGDTYETRAARLMLHSLELANCWEAGNGDQQSAGILRGEGYEPGSVIR
jgi:hypothetical protein